ncbi:MAG: ATP phosphoribosyltransferase regulatory subunit [Chromatiales bacterium]|nr:ATP phosphoribosyltransferase regulatory subunit [Chromatiales bacterium]
MRRWLLPEDDRGHPAAAGAARRARCAARLLDLFARPRLRAGACRRCSSISESLLTGTGPRPRPADLQAGRPALGPACMGVRADITPQVARIDAHLLNREGVTRLCYCGSVLHTLPAASTATREPLQIGAELYGHAGLEADVEVLRAACSAALARGRRARAAPRHRPRRRVPRAWPQARPRRGELEAELFDAAAGEGRCRRCARC